MTKALDALENAAMTPELENTWGITRKFHFMSLRQSIVKLSEKIQLQFL